MNFNYKLIKERFDLHVPEEGARILQEFELDKSAQRLIGLIVSSDREDMVFLRGSQRITLNNYELFPVGFESKLLMSGLNVAPDERMVTIGELATGNGKLVVEYQDTVNELTSFTPYNYVLYAFSVIE